MDIQEEDDDFDLWWEGNAIAMMCEEDEALKIWQAAKAQAVPKGYKVVPVNYECVWCGCTELDGWTDEAMIEAQEPAND